MEAKTETQEQTQQTQQQVDIDELFNQANLTIQNCTPETVDGELRSLVHTYFISLHNNSDANTVVADFFAKMRSTTIDQQYLKSMTESFIKNTAFSRKTDDEYNVVTKYVDALLSYPQLSPSATECLMITLTKFKFKYFTSNLNENQRTLLATKALEAANRVRHSIFGRKVSYDESCKKPFNLCYIALFLFYTIQQKDKYSDIVVDILNNATKTHNDEGKEVFSNPDIQFFSSALIAFGTFKNRKGAFVHPKHRIIEFVDSVNERIAPMVLRTPAIYFISAKTVSKNFSMHRILTEIGNSYKTQNTDQKQTDQKQRKHKRHSDAEEQPVAEPAEAEPAEAEAEAEAEAVTPVEVENPNSYAAKLKSEAPVQTEPVQTESNHTESNQTDSAELAQSESDQKPSSRSWANNDYDSDSDEEDS